MTRHRLPAIRRARDFWLYGFDDNRYLDLWQNDGRAYYGHNPKGLALDLKNRLSPSLYSPFPHPVFGKVLKLVAQVFPGTTPLIFPSFDTFLSFAREKGFPSLPPDPWSLLEWTGALAEKVQLFRPDRPLPVSSSLPYLVPLLPVPADLGVVLVLATERSQPTNPNLLPQSTPLQLTGLLWGLRLWASHLGADIPDDFPDSFPFFRREGRYLIPQASQEEYFGLFKFARAKGIVLNPRKSGISILPRTSSSGGWKNILAVLEGPYEF